ncbi:MAG: calcium-binding protein, partial [Pseudomonadota bacterium]
GTERGDQSNLRAPRTEDILEYRIYIPEDQLGIYYFEARTSRDPGGPGDRRNDLFLNIQQEDGPAEIIDLLTDQGSDPEPFVDGFIKIFGAQDEVWSDARNYDGQPNNPRAELEFTEAGFYTIQVAGRSQGYHVDFIELFRGDRPSDGATDSAFVPPTAPARGTDGADALRGTTGDDILYGLEGGDTLSGREGNDLMRGGAGNDTAYGGAGDDIIYGGSGNDRLFGGAGDDDLRGLDGRDTLRGGDGADILRGGGGADMLFGEGGNDRLFGGGGSDTLSGGAGNDGLTGGGGADTFVFGAGFGVDQVWGFATGTDDLHLDADLWAGTLTSAEVLTTFATTSGGRTVFDFGGGDRLIVNLPAGEISAEDILII